MFFNLTSLVSLASFTVTSSVILGTGQHLEIWDVKVLFSKKEKKELTIKIDILKESALEDSQ